MHLLRKILGHYALSSDDASSAGDVSPPATSPASTPAASPPAAQLDVAAALAEQVRTLTETVAALAARVSSPPPAAAAAPSAPRAASAAALAPSALDEVRAELELRDALDAADVPKDKRQLMLRLFRAERPPVVAEWVARTAKEFAPTAKPAVAAPLPVTNTNTGPPAPPATLPTNPMLMTNEQVAGMTDMQALELFEQHLASTGARARNPIRVWKDLKRQMNAANKR